MLVLLFKGTGPLSRAIRWHTRSDYSHAAILHCGEVYESREFRGVRRIPLDEALKGCAVDVFEVRTSLEQEEATLDFLGRQMGKKYDYASVLRFLPRRQETRASSGKWFCSELVFVCLQMAGIQLLLRIQPAEVAPGHLALSPLMRFIETYEIPDHPGLLGFDRLLRSNPA